MYPVNLGFVFLNKKFFSRIVITRPAATRNDPTFPVVLDIDTDEAGDIEVFFDGQLLSAESGSSLHIDPNVVFVNQFKTPDEFIECYARETRNDLLNCGFPVELLDQYTF
jgi:hypothetical protein